MTRVAVFASGRGSNFRAIVEHISLGVLKNVEASLLVTNDSQAPSLQVAKERNIPCVFIEGVYGRKFLNKDERAQARELFDEHASEALRKHQIDLVALAGFMQVLGPTIVRDFNRRIMNIHPALDLRRFGGPGMFGEHVHEAVLRAGETESGCTVHYVDESVDGGPIILQTPIPIRPSDNAESLAERILTQEHRTYSKAIQLHADGRICYQNGRATLDLSGEWENEWNRRQDAFIRLQTERMQTHPLKVLQ